VTFRLLACLLGAAVLAVTAARAAETPTPLPEPRIEVTVAGELLSVDLVDAPFGTVLGRIGSEAGFEVRVSAEVSSRTVTTSFTDMELERGINRLLGLIGQKTFFMHYAPDGSIQKIDVFKAAPSSVRPQPPRPPAPAWRPPASRRPARPFPPARQQPQPGFPPGFEEQPFEGFPEGEEPFGEPLPGFEGEEFDQGGQPGPAYIPPTRSPAYIPPQSEDR
jgi:hypothetical protein